MFKFYLLVTIITWSFGGGYQNTPQFKRFASAESAAIHVYQDSRRAPWEVEPDHKEYRLYSVSLDENDVPKIERIEIPEVEFKRRKE